MCAYFSDAFDECDHLCEVYGRGGISASEGVADASCEFFGIVSIGPGVGIARLLEETGVLSEAFFERVEVFEESVDGVVPSSGCFGFADGDDALWG